MAGPTICRAPGPGLFGPDFCSRVENNESDIFIFVLLKRTINGQFRSMPGTTEREYLCLSGLSLIGRFWTGARVCLSNRKPKLYSERVPSLCQRTGDGKDSVDN